MTASDHKKLAKLLPHVRERVEALIAACEARGVRLMVGNTARNAAKQLEHVKAGRAATVKSWHLLGRAADLYVLHGKVADTKATDRASYAIMHEEARRLGFRVFGFRVLRKRDGRTFTDPYHVEWRDGMTWDEAARAA